MTAGILGFLQGYEGLQGLQVDCVPEQAGFSLSTVAGEPLLTRYLDGTEKRKLQFSLLGRMGYGQDAAAQQESIRWFSDFEGWLRRQSLRSLDLGEGRRALSFAMTTAPAVEDIGENGLCCWGATLELVYLQQQI